MDTVVNLLMMVCIWNMINNKEIEKVHIYSQMEINTQEIMKKKTW